MPAAQQDCAGLILSFLLGKERSEDA